MDDKLMTMQEWHKVQAIQNFNKTWDFIDLNDRSEEDNLQMVHTAHASRYHWGEVGTPLEFARGEWQISRVYSVLGMFESAFYHGKSSLDYCLKNNIKDFDLAFAYEAVARAYMVGNNHELMEKYLSLAREAAAQIAEKDDRDYLLSEIKTITISE